jgi:SAM-dependent methyltransferase
MNRDQLAAEIKRFEWYHTIPIPGTDLVTPGEPGFVASCQWNARHLSQHDLRGKRVLDIGARDCMFSLQAEQMGALSVDAIDNDISEGARQVLLPFLKSSVNLRSANICKFETSQRWDIVLFFGVLYHLRYPFQAFRKISDITEIGGLLLIEAGMLEDEKLANLEILYCPTARSPYEPSSCSFFNLCGLDATLLTFGFKREGNCDYAAKEPKHKIRRAFVAYRKVEEGRFPYWEDVHRMHSGRDHTLWKTGGL